MLLLTSAALALAVSTQPGRALPGAPPPPPGAKSTLPTPCYRDAMVVNPIAPDYPDAARRLNPSSGTVLVRVSLGANGKVLATRIVQSSGNAALDQATIDAVRRSTYTPKLVDCKDVAGSFLFRADFGGGHSVGEGPVLPKNYAQNPCEVPPIAISFNVRSVADHMPSWPAGISTELGIEVNATGDITSIAVVKSSGDPAFDAAALRNATTIRYTPAKHECKAVAGHALFLVSSL